VVACQPVAVNFAADAALAQFKVMVTSPDGSMTARPLNPRRGPTSGWCPRAPGSWTVEYRTEDQFFEVAQIFDGLG
jgi:hypothetical protein